MPRTETVSPITLVPGASLAYSRRYWVNKNIALEPEDAKVEAMFLMRDDIQDILANKNLICVWRSEVVFGENDEWEIMVTATLHCSVQKRS